MVSAPLLVLAAYAAGAIPTAFWTGKLHGKDLRTLGSCNLGATNVQRVLGWGAAIPVGLFDVFKGFAPVWWFPQLDDRTAPVWTVAYGAAAIVGHVFSFWVRFRGGKGVATASGVFWVLAPEATALALVAFTGVVWLTRYVSLGSMVAAVVLAAAVYFNGEAPATIVCAAGVAALVLYRHRGNMVRLHAGRERRISQRA